MHGIDDKKRQRAGAQNVFAADEVQRAGECLSFFIRVDSLLQTPTTADEDEALAAGWKNKSENYKDIEGTMFVSC